MESGWIGQWLQAAGPEPAAEPAVAAAVAAVDAAVVAVGDADAVSGPCVCEGEVWSHRIHGDCWAGHHW